MGKVLNRSLMPFVLILLLLACGNAADAGSQDRKLPGTTRLYDCLNQTFRSYYPEVTSNTTDRKMHFEYDTRVFLVHHPLKNGEWQDAVEVRGPNRGGFLCDLELVPGTYNGAAVVPQEFDERYYKVLLMAPGSQKHHCYLHARLFYPRDTKPEFIKQYSELINGFEKYLQK